MTKEMLIKVLNLADAAMAEFMEERGMEDADGCWGGVGLALDVVQAYDDSRNLRAIALKKLADRQANPPMVPGFLLEVLDPFSSINANWEPCEFVIEYDEGVEFEGGIPTDKLELDDWSGIFEALPGVLSATELDSDWGERLGIHWNEDAAPDTWHGICGSEWREGCFWRVRRLTVSGKYSAQAVNKLTNLINR